MFGGSGGPSGGDVADGEGAKTSDVVADASPGDPTADGVDPVDPVDTPAGVDAPTTPVDAGPIGPPDAGCPDCVCVDGDGDGFGEGCGKGADCDDTNPQFTTECPDCATALSAGCPCTDDAAQTFCFGADVALAGVGQCKPGVRSCVDGYWSPCTGEKLPSLELCDGLDNDCDGETDNGLTGCEEPPDCTDKDGDGHGEGCVAGDDCDDTNPYFAATCPSCADTIVDGCPCANAGLQTMCYTGNPGAVGTGICKAGKRTCSAGFWSACLNEVLPQTETCDNKDNDCDGQVDENVPGCEKPPACVDDDGDGFGAGCPQGPDCNDSNPNFALTCPNCAASNYPGCPCADPSQKQTCYSGDSGLIGIGDCKAGTRKCTGGYWTECIGEVVETSEVCDGLDNDCDGQVDEGVLGECGDCNNLCFLDSDGAGGATPFNPTGQNASGGIVLTPEGWLTLSESSYNLHFIWISNSAENTVSKLDTITGKELGRYKTCSDPSRTAVDSTGDAWVACRGDGIVHKIGNIPELCPDKNGNGVIETSHDANGDGIIQSNEMLPKGQDECVLFDAHPEPADNLGRALGVAYDGSAWVGYWNVKRLKKLKADTGAVLDSIDLPNNPYGLAVDTKGVIWVSGRGGNQLVRVHPDTKQVSTYSPGGCFEPYGIAIDEFDRIWLANCCCGDVAWMFNPQGGGWTSVASEARPRGIASNKNGLVFVANDTSNRVTKINTQTLKKVGSVDIGGGRFPLGMAVDSDGYVWAVNQGSSSATKLDPNTMQIVLEHPVGVGPYCYSDMTGSTFFKSVVPEGYYLVTYEAPELDDYLVEWYDTVWDSVTVDYFAPPGTTIKVQARAAASAPALALEPWSAALGPFPPGNFPASLATALGPAAKGTKLIQLKVILTSFETLKPVVKKIEIKHGAKPKT